VKVQVGIAFVLDYLASITQGLMRTNFVTNGCVKNSCVTQQHTIALARGMMSWMGQGMDSLMKLKGIFRSLSCLIGLPLLPFHVCGTYTVRTPTIPQCRAIFLQLGQQSQSNCRGYGGSGYEVFRQDANSPHWIMMCLNIHFPRASDDHTRCYIPKGLSSQRISIRSNIYLIYGLSTSSTTLSAQE